MLAGCTDELHLDPMPAGDGGGEQDVDGGSPFNPHNPDSGRPIRTDAAVATDDALECRIPTDPSSQTGTPCSSSIRWQHTVTNGEPEMRPNFVATDAAGNIYWMMTMFGLIQLGGRDIGDPFTPSVLLVSYTSDGALRWVFDIHDANGEAFALSATQACVGAGTASNGVTLSSKLDPDVSGLETIACVTLDGELRWSRDIDSSLTALRSMSFDGEGNLYVGGHFQGELRISTALNAASRDTTEPALKGDGFVASYAADGSARWLTTMGGPHNDEVLFVAGLEDGRVALVGEHAESFEIGAGPTPDLGASGSQGGAAFVALLDRSGALEWAVRAPGGIFEDETLRPSALLIDAESRIVVTYEHGFDAVAYDELGAIAEQHTGVAMDYVTAIAAYPSGFATFAGAQHGDQVIGALRTTDLDFAPRSTRLLVERSMEYEGTIGFNAVAVAPDGSLIVAGEWGNGLYHRIVVLEP